MNNKYFIDETDSDGAYLTKDHSKIYLCVYDKSMKAEMSVNLLNIIEYSINIFPELKNNIKTLIGSNY